MTEKSLVILKPDCTSKNFIGEVINRFESEGLQVKYMQMIRNAPKKKLFQHYERVGKLLTRLKEQKGYDEGLALYDEIVNYMHNGSIVVLVFVGEGVVAHVRRIIGATRPWEAESGTIRADFGLKNPNAPIRNVVHASATPEEAEKELKIWVPFDEVIELSRGL